MCEGIVYLSILMSHYWVAVTLIDRFFYDRYLRQSYSVVSSKFTAGVVDTGGKFTTAFDGTGN
jgi:hypothetical protein